MFNEPSLPPLSKVSFLPDQPGALPALRADQLTLVSFPRGARLPLGLAEDISALMLAQYGTRYPKPSAFTPEGIQSSVATGLASTHLLMGPNGQVVAHAAVLDSGNGAAEIGRIIVAQGHRGLGLGTKVTEAAFEAALKESFHSITAYTFSSHPVSQRIFHALGFAVAGIQVADWPDVFGTGARDGAVVFTRIIDPAVRANREVFLAPEIAEPANLVFASLNLTRTSATPTAPPAPGTVSPAMLDGDLASMGSVHFNLLPDSDPGLVDPDGNRSPAQGVRFVSARFDLGHPSALAHAAALAAAGFKFATLEPGLATDWLVMQRPESFPDAHFTSGVLVLAHQETHDLYRALRGLPETPTSS